MLKHGCIGNIIYKNYASLGESNQQLIKPTIGSRLTGQWINGRHLSLSNPRALLRARERGIALRVT